MNATTLFAALFSSALLIAPALALDPHVEAVMRTVEAAKGKVERTEDGLSLKLARISQALAAAACPMSFLLRSARIPELTVCRHTAHPGILRAPCRQCHLAAPRDAILEKCGLVDLAVANTGPHDHRKEDPYDAAFFEHLGHIHTLESLNVISTKLHDAWIPHITKLKGIELGTHNATPAALKHLISLPLESIQ